MNTEFQSATVSQPVPKPGKPFYISSIIIGAIGVLPLLVYLLVCLHRADTGYRGGGNPTLIILMGFIGFVLHGIGLACGVVALVKGAKLPAFVGLIVNACILLAIFLFGFIAFVIG